MPRETLVATRYHPRNERASTNNPSPKVHTRSKKAKRVE
jgi:hypothetical protein